MINFLKVISIFLLVFLLMIPLSFVTQTSKNTEMLDKYSELKIREVCQASPEIIYFQECFKKDLSRISSSYTPQDALKMIRAIENIYKLDKIRSTDAQQILFGNLLYFENWIIFIENEKNMEISRDDSSFFDIAIIFYVKYVVKNEISKVLGFYKEQKLLSLKPDSDSRIKARWDRVDKKMASINFN